MRASTVRIIAGFGLLLALAASAHWIGPGPDAGSGSGTASHASNPPATTGARTR